VRAEPRRSAAIEGQRFQRLLDQSRPAGIIGAGKARGGDPVQLEIVGHAAVERFAATAARQVKGIDPPVAATLVPGMKNPGRFPRKFGLKTVQFGAVPVVHCPVSPNRVPFWVMPTPAAVRLMEKEVAIGVPRVSIERPRSG
jgi:hypothetical protein